MSNKIENENIGIADRTNMAFSSSLVTYGRGKGVVVETGMNTEVGKIAKIINNTDNKINKNFAFIFNSFIDLWRQRYGVLV